MDGQRPAAGESRRSPPGRRLRVGDLRRFLEAGTGQERAATATSLASTIALQGMVVDLGSHLACFYTTDAGRLRLGVPFLRDALLAGQSVLLLGGTPDVREHYFAALQTEGVDTAEAVHAGLLMLYPEVSGSAGEQVARVEQLLMAASRRRPGPIRILAEVAASGETAGSVAEHLLVEQQLGGLCKRFPVVAVCAYDVRAFDGVTIVEALKRHPDIFGRQVGYWLN